MYLLTRPLPKLESSVLAFKKAGLDVTGIATSDIIFNNDETQRLVHTLQDNASSIAIITSTFAARVIIDHIDKIPDSVNWMAVGKSTAGLLRQIGLGVTFPTQQDSEGLLQLPELLDAKLHQIVIIKGEGGRTTLLNTLQTRGANVNEFTVYRRHPLVKPVETNHWQWSDVKGIIATSAEMAQQLFTFYGQNELSGQRWLTVSERIANYLHTLGVSNIAIHGSASDAALIAWLKDNWE